MTRPSPTATTRPGVSATRKLKIAFTEHLLSGETPEALEMLEINPWLATEISPRYKNFLSDVELRPYLHVVAHLGMPELVEAMLAKGAHLEEWGPQRRTALLALASDATPGGVDLMRMYVERGSRCDVVDEAGRSIAYMSFDVVPADLFRTFVERGAPLNVLRAGVHTGMPAHPAAEMLQHVYASTREGAVEAGLRAFKLRVEAGADVVKCHGLPEDYPLAIALSKGDISTAEYLVSRGADVAVADGHGKTILHRMTLSESAVEFLLKHGLNVDARDAWGQTPLASWAQESDSMRWPGLTAYMIALIARGATLDARDNRGAASSTPRQHLESDEELGAACRATSARAAAQSALLLLAASSSP